MRPVLAALAMAGALAGPTFAQTDPMAADTTCADFTAMDADGQMESVEMMSTEMEEGEAMAEGDAMAPEEMMTEAAAACEAHPDMMVGEAMQMMMDQ